METSPNIEPFIPPGVPSPSTPSVQASIPDHTQPSPSPLVSVDSPASYPYPADTDMLITQIPSTLPSPYASESQPANIKCDYCHVQVTTQVTRLAEWIADPFDVPYWCRFMLWMLCVFWDCCYSSISLLSYVSTHLSKLQGDALDLEIKR